MKKLLLSLALAFVGTFAFAEDTKDYITLRQSNGATVSYKIDGLKLIFDEESITVSEPNKEYVYYAVEDLDAILFSATDITAIATAVVADETAETAVYTIDGRLVAKGVDAQEGLAAGVYIVKTGKKSIKISVR